MVRTDTRFSTILYTFNHTMFLSCLKKLTAFNMLCVCCLCLCVCFICPGADPTPICSCKIIFEVILIFYSSFIL